MNPGNLFAQGATQSKVVTPPGYTETWSGYTAGDTWTQLSAAYGRSSAIAPTIQTNANGAPNDAPSGKVMRFGLTGSAAYIYNTAWDAVIAANAAGAQADIDILIKFVTRATSLSMSAGFGKGQGSAATGLSIRRLTGPITQVLLINNTSVSSPSSPVVLLNNQPDGQTYWARLAIVGGTLQAKAWVAGTAEPGSWSTNGTTAISAFTSLRYIGSNDADAIDVLGMSFSIGGTAPTF